MAQVLAWLAAGLVAVLAIAAQQPPGALGTAAPASRFSAVRAIAAVRPIVQRPHPLASAEHADARRYLVQALRSLGAEVHVETATAARVIAPRRVVAGTVHNIIATLPGSANQRAVMLSAHYDSVPWGPGAADDGAGVATLLETVRALQAGPRLKNDVRVVLTDGEEDGLLGASAYVAKHPDLAQQVGVVLNFEARGSSGVVSMFETSAGNGWLIDALAAAAPYPVASSLAYTLYTMLPNDTDLTVFKHAGLAGLNFAFIGGFEDYHTPHDTLARLDADSVQHMGSYALALARHFGQTTYPEARQPDRVYFNWLGAHLVDYPGWVSWLLLVLAGGLLSAVMLVALRRDHLRFMALVIGFAGFVLLVAVVLASMFGAWWLLKQAIGSHLLHGDTASNAWLAVGLLLTGIAAATLAQRGLLARRGGSGVVIGMLCGFALLAVVASGLLPGASYLFAWPLVAALLGLLPAMRSHGGVALAWTWLAAVPALLLFAPLIANLWIALGMNDVGLAAIALVLGLLLAVAAPLLARLARGWRTAVPVLLLAAAACLACGALRSQYSVAHPQRDSLRYSLDADRGEALWLSHDAAPDHWTAQYLGARPRRGRAPDFNLRDDASVLMHAAPALPLLPPAMRVVDDARSEGVRKVRLHLASPRGAPILLLRLPPTAGLRSLAWNGVRVALGGGAGAGRPWRLAYIGAPAGGVELELTLTVPGPVECRLADRSRGLPATAGYPVRAATDTQLVYGGDTAVTRACAF